MGGGLREWEPKPGRGPRGRFAALTRRESAGTSGRDSSAGAGRGGRRARGVDGQLSLHPSVSIESLTTGTVAGPSVLIPP